MAAKLMVGVIVTPNFLKESIPLLRYLGEIETQSRVIPFNFTNYYEKEMGKGLLRYWAAFTETVAEENLKETKLKTIELENQTKIKEKRQINLDPGILTLSKYVLATSKNYAHRVALGDGIYAEVTLIYKKPEGFCPLAWTYPDYKENLSFFNQIRENLLKETKDIGHRTSDIRP